MARTSLTPLHRGLVAALLLAACGRPARDDTAFRGAVSAWRDMRYLSASGDQRLDMLVPRDQPSPPPLLVYVHGGGWMTLRKEDAMLAVAPYLAAGWAVANVEYRLGFEATAPAAAADVRCAIKWVARHATDFGADPSRLVLAGESAGAHLVMLAAFADSTAGLDGSCPGSMPAVSGVVDWAGITDVNDLLTGANERGWAVGWVGRFPGAELRARRASPLHWIRPGLPPVVIVHGDADGTVPFAHAERLHAALDSAGVPNEFVVLHGADHVAPGSAHAAAAWSAVLHFLAQHSGPTP